MIDGDRVDFVGMDFADFIEDFDRRWEPGQHIALVGPTGVGKTTFAAHLLPRRKYVLALDPKGGDSTLRTLEQHGFVRCSSWPPPKQIMRAIDDGEPARLIISHPWRTSEDKPKLIALLGKAIDGAFEMGGWTLYVDELQLAADRRMGGLSEKIEQNLIAARDRKVSVVTSFQRPANVPRTAGDQSTYLVVWYTRDTDVVRRLAEMMGRPGYEIRAAMKGLDRHCVMVSSNNPHDPIIGTYVPKV